MKKKYFIVMALLSLLAQAQVNRFYYQYTYSPDFNNKEEVKKEMMILDIQKNSSVYYYSQEKLITDSTSKTAIEKQINSVTGSIRASRNTPGQDYTVTKDYPDFKTYLFTRINNDRYKVKEDKKPEWKIFPDTRKIGEYNTQKALTTYGGREWIAWFSADIPFQDGPYKFYGLPGLIVKIEDTTGSHIMTLVGNKVIKNPSEEKENRLPDNVAMGGKAVEITKDQYKKVWKTYVNDPNKNMREMMMKNGGDPNARAPYLIFRTSDGKEISDPNKVLKEIEGRIKAGFQKNNNPIEPDLIK